MTNRSFIEMMGHEGASEREPWVKVRWINIGGISWDVLSALAIKYGQLGVYYDSCVWNEPFDVADLHPLALEDILHQHGHARSKADYYNKHLFLRVLCHALTHRTDCVPDMLDPEIPHSSSPEPITVEDEKIGSEEDEEHTIFGGSALVSRFSTTREMSSITKRRPWGAKGGGDTKSSPSRNSSLMNLVHRGSIVSCTLRISCVDFDIFHCSKGSS